MKNFNYILTNEKLTIISEGKQYQINIDDARFEQIIQLLKSKKYDEIIEILDVVKLVEKIVIVDGDELILNNQHINSRIVSKIIEFRNNGLDFEPLIKFMKNQLLNPNGQNIEDLYDFIEHGNMPITSDGCFLAYKVVNSNYKDKYTKSFDNSVGSICEMKRDYVDSNRNQACSTGLHVCTFDYIDEYKDFDDKVMIVKVNPKDVVSVPYDYNFAKMRCCRYEVIDEYKNFDDSKEFFDSPYYEQYINEDVQIIHNEYESPCYINDDIRTGNKFEVVGDDGNNFLCRKLRGQKTIKIEKNRFKQIFCVD